MVGEGEVGAGLSQSASRFSRISRRSWLSAIVLLGVVAISLASWATWRATSDPRAYPGSEIRSLEEVLRYYHIDLPECALETVRFSQYAQLTTDTLYMRFAGDDHCVTEFLARNGLDDEQVEIVNGLPFIPEFGVEFGWPQDSQREYLTLNGYLSGSEAGSLVDAIVAIDNAISPHILYLQAGIL